MEFGLLDGLQQTVVAETLKRGQKEAQPNDSEANAPDCQREVGWERAGRSSASLVVHTAPGQDVVWIGRDDRFEVGGSGVTTGIAASRNPRLCKLPLSAEALAAFKQTLLAKPTWEGVMTRVRSLVNAAQADSDGLRDLRYNIREPLTQLNPVNAAEQKVVLEHLDYMDRYSTRAVSDISYSRYLRQRIEEVKGMKLDGSNKLDSGGVTGLQTIFQTLDDHEKGLDGYNLPVIGRVMRPSDQGVLARLKAQFR